MENQNAQPIQTQVQPPTTPVANQPQAPIQPVPEAPKPKAKITDLAKDIYQNIKDKKVFKLLIVLFGILVLIIISGVIYSMVKNSGNKQTVLVSPSPVATPQIMLTEESKKSKSTLEELKSKIINLDIEQKHLTPPNVDFDISF